jgi:hypothetical protein
VDVLVAVLVGLLIVVVAWQVMWLAGRLERLATRVEAARAGLDAQLVRRAAAVQALIDSDPAAFGARAQPLRALCRTALDSDPAGREAAENELGAALTELPADSDPALRRDLADAAQRVVLARRFYNDAVRDTLALRHRRLARMLRLSARKPVPGFFEIADTVVDPLTPTVRTAPGDEPAALD